uniref:Uncharacterized protein n=1 Tax=Setaria italica TaxID=4555 RepID=K3ZYP8_SETIT
MSLKLPISGEYRVSTYVSQIQHIQDLSQNRTKARCRIGSTKEILKDDNNVMKVKRCNITKVKRMIKECSIPCHVD